jgi:hypothetical protein
MTVDQYYEAYGIALRGGSKVTRQIMTELKKVYEAAAKLAANEVRNATLAGHADITIDSWLSLQTQLEKGAQAITKSLDDLVKEGVQFDAKALSSIDEKYLIDIIKENSLNISQTGIRNLFISVNSNVVSNMVNRIFANGYSFSERIWRVGLDYQNQIKKLVSSGLAAGRDLVDIADDIGVYVKKGRQGLVKRWGDLKAGTRSFLRRIRKDLDYNALRLVRSELYASLQSVAIQNGQANPAATGWYEWIRQNNTDWGCDCPDNEANSPYRLNDIPDYPHPNCLCIIQPVLRSREDFVKDLERWSEGENVGYLDKWNEEFFQFVA